MQYLVLDTHQVCILLTKGIKYKYFYLTVIYTKEKL